MHHAYRHGLLEHTVHMARAAGALLPLYREVDPDLALAGILLHDIGKTIEYTGALAPRRSRRGILQGHVVLGYQLVRKAGLKAKLDSDRLERLEHIILSHQGEMEWGAAALAATPEAVFVSLIDNLDAKMGMVQRALRQAAAGEEFSERLGNAAHRALTPSYEAIRGFVTNSRYSWTSARSRSLASNPPYCRLSVSRNSAFDLVFLSRWISISIDSIGPSPCIARRRP